MFSHTKASISHRLKANTLLDAEPEPLSPLISNLSKTLPRLSEIRHGGFEGRCPREPERPNQESERAEEGRGQKEAAGEVLREANKAQGNKQQSRGRWTVTGVQGDCPRAQPRPVNHDQRGHEASLRELAARGERGHVERGDTHAGAPPSRIVASPLQRIRQAQGLWLLKKAARHGNVEMAQYTADEGLRESGRGVDETKLTATVFE